jgi:hypothetical protein
MTLKLVREGQKEMGIVLYLTGIDSPSECTIFESESAAR